MPLVRNALSVPVAVERISRRAPLPSLSTVAVTPAFAVLILSRTWAERVGRFDRDVDRGLGAALRREARLARAPAAEVDVQRASARRRVGRRKTPRGERLRGRERLHLERIAARRRAALGRDADRRRVRRAADDLTPRRIARQRRRCVAKRRSQALQLAVLGDLRLDLRRLALQCDDRLAFDREQLVDDRIDVERCRCRWELMVVMVALVGGFRAAGSVAA